MFVSLLFLYDRGGGCTDLPRPPTDVRGRALPTHSMNNDSDNDKKKKKMYYYYHYYYYITINNIA